jgi:hypothetical protein
VGIGHFGGAVAANHKIPGNFYMDNFMLKTAVETGLLGIIFYLILIYNSLIWGFRALKTIKTQDIYYYKLVQGIIAGMCGVIFHNFFENVFEVPMIVVYY